MVLLSTFLLAIDDMKVPDEFNFELWLLMKISTEQTLRKKVEADFYSYLPCDIDHHWQAVEIENT